MISLKTNDHVTAERHIFSATFRTLDGATAALCQMGDARYQGLIDLENAVALTRNRAGNIEFLQSEALPGWPGCGSGAYIMGIFPLCFAHGQESAGDRETFLARLHAAGFEDDDLLALAEELSWETSLLMAVIDRHQVAAADNILNEVAVKIGWAVMNATVAHLVEQFAVAIPGRGNTRGCCTARRGGT